MLIQAMFDMFDCRYKLNHIGVRQHKLEGAEKKKRAINHNLGDWMGLQVTKFPSVDYTFRRELQSLSNDVFSFYFIFFLFLFLLYFFLFSLEQSSTQQLFLFLKIFNLFNSQMIEGQSLQIVHECLRSAWSYFNSQKICVVLCDLKEIYLILSI